MPSVPALSFALLEAAAWCERPDALAAGLRSRTLRPARRLGALESAGCEAYFDEVTQVAATRAALGQPRATCPPGRLLAFDPCESLFDGAAEVASGGFFDANNAPPWDTWVGVLTRSPRPPGPDDGPWSRFLLCWVPREWVPRVEAGIRVNPEGCITWASTLRAAAVTQLAAHVGCE